MAFIMMNMSCQNSCSEGKGNPSDPSRRRLTLFQLDVKASMTRDIRESDWKRFKALRQLALERFCERVLLDIGRIGADAGKSQHERYLDIYRLIHDRDEELGRVFNDLSRSKAVIQIVQIRSLGLLTEEELAGFSAELRSILSFCESS